MLRLRRRQTIANKSSKSNRIRNIYIYRTVIQSFLTAYVEFHKYVANLSMNSTANGSSGSCSCFNFTVRKLAATVAFCLIIIFSLVANSPIVILVCKTPSLKKTINYFIANMASSDLLYSIFWITCIYNFASNSYLAWAFMA